MDNKLSKKEIEFLVNQLGLRNNMANDFIALLKGKKLHTVSATGSGRRTKYYDNRLYYTNRLDAIGAIGIVRTFNYGGFKNRTIYNPNIAPKLNMSKEEYKNNKAPTLNHFYEKLLLLKDKMNTESGKIIAIERHLFMEKFLSQFYAEWDGEK